MALFIFGSWKKSKQKEHIPCTRSSNDTWAVPKPPKQCVKQKLKKIGPAAPRNQSLSRRSSKKIGPGPRFR
jgi:hypothetical protein